jgi:hypothetical protein
MQTAPRLCRLCSEVTPQAALPPGRSVELAPDYAWETCNNQRRTIQVWLCLSCMTANLEVYPVRPHPQDLRELARAANRGGG